MTQQSTGLADRHESNDDLESAAASCAESLRRDPDNVQMLVRMGSILHQLGRTDGAIGAFERAVAVAPASGEASANLAVVLAAAGRIDDAVVASARAAGLAPESAAVQCNYGDALMAQGRFAAARDAYRRALALQSDSAEILNRLACAQRALGDYRAAEDCLRKTVALAPGFGPALVNLGTLEGLRGDFVSAERLLQQALDTGSLVPEAFAEAANALGLFRESRRLQPALAEAVARELPGAIGAAVRATRPELLAADAGFLSRFAALAMAIAHSDAASFARSGQLPPSWPAIEAHFALHRPEAPDEVRQTIRSVEHRSVGDPAADRDLVRFERAVRRRCAAVPSTGDAVAWESQLRYWHAAIHWHHPLYLPGQFKPVPNLTTATPLFRLVPPHAVVGTLRAFYDGPYATVPAGPCRAALVLLALGECHPFVDGNGRLARLAMNAELESAGFRPILMSQDSMARYIGALPAFRSQGDAGPIIALLADASRETGELLRAVANTPSLEQHRR
jgi:Flp pilus assembly protein TadD